MREQGVVVRTISARLAEVAFQKSLACAKCGLCHDAGEGMAGIEAVNDVGAKRDDIVEVEIPSDEVVKGSMVVFLLPVFFLIGGYLGGSFLIRLAGQIAWEESGGVIFALIFLGLSFFAIKWYDKNVQQKQALRARIVRISTSP
ncbi:SoxR reducing system RseC family protein [Candidatus Margulisiibacteriota bacterium]